MSFENMLIRRPNCGYAGPSLQETHGCIFVSPSIVPSQSALASLDGKCDITKFPASIDTYLDFEIRTYNEWTS